MKIIAIALLLGSGILSAQTPAAKVAPATLVPPTAPSVTQAERDQFKDLRISTSSTGLEYAARENKLLESIRKSQSDLDALRKEREDKLTPDLQKLQGMYNSLVGRCSPGTFDLNTATCVVATASATPGK